MIGKQEYQPKLFSTVDMESLIPKNHLLRKIDKILDLSFIRPMTEKLYCSDNGRPSIDPELFFRIYLIIYLYNIESDRQTCEELQYNLAYRWFCKLSLEDDVPNHSSLSKIRDRLGEDVFKQIFEKIVKLCINRKLVGSSVMMDGSIVKADAALNSLVERTAADIDPKEPYKYIKNRKFSNQTHVSKTDPDATLAGKVGEYKKLAYKVHNMADRNSRVIVDTHVTSGSGVEGKVMFERLDHYQSIFDRAVKQFIADRGYGYGDNLVELKKRKVESFVPNFHSKVGSGIDTNKFKYDKESDRYICMQGHALTPTFAPSYLKVNMQVYRITDGHCKNCPLKTECFGSAKSTYRERRIAVNVNRDIQEETKLREQDPEFRTAMGERQWKIEGLFAEAKKYHGLDRARYRGRSKMQIQAYMTASVQNLKRLVTLLPDFKMFLEIWIKMFKKDILKKYWAGFLPALLKTDSN